jgi:prepilin signal peptidase PulO-like enzyme (type II secretory pathway)
MIIFLFLLVFGLSFGSFVNALVWRVNKQEELEYERPKRLKKNKASNSKLQSPNYSILHGRSMCPNCKHELAAKDLVPVLSWLSLRAKCRYCKKPISWQYPVVEMLTALLFVFSYTFWPADFSQTWQVVAFISWLIVLIGLIALTVYDIKWMILPDKIIFPLIAIAGLSIILQLVFGRPLSDLGGICLAVLIGSGIFWLIYQISKPKGKWIGGGDVKLGFLLGLIVAKPEYSFMLLFLASIIAMLFISPLLIAKKLKKDSKIPFGPFLIAASYIAVLFGSNILTAYKSLFGL